MKLNVVQLVLVDEVFDYLPTPLLTSSRPFKSNLTAMSVEYLNHFQESPPDLLENL